MLLHKLFKNSSINEWIKKTYLTHSFKSKTVIINKSLSTKNKLKTNTFG